MFVFQEPVDVSSPSGKKESISMTMTREPASVPNFRTLQKSSSLEEQEQSPPGENNQIAKAQLALQKVAENMGKSGSEDRIEAAAFFNLSQQKAGGENNVHLPLSQQLQLQEFATFKPGGSTGSIDDDDEATTATTTTTATIESCCQSTLPTSPPPAYQAATATVGAVKTPSSGMATLARSDSAYTFQSYDCSSSRSSTLSSSGAGGGGGGGGSGNGRNNNQNSMQLPKSSSVNRGFKVCSSKIFAISFEDLIFSAFPQTGSDIRLIDVDEEELATYADEFSSLSGYDSIEAVDLRDEDCQSRLSFANPHYLGPDVQAILERKRVNRRNVLLRDDSHQSFAQALNSPADSLFSDYQVRKTEA